MQYQTQLRFRRLLATCLATVVLSLAAVVSPSSTLLGSTKAQTQALKALKSGDYQQAEKLYRDLLVKDPHDRSARLGLSFALYKQRNLQGAYDNAARVVMLDPLSARAHSLLGASILAAGEFRLSIEEFRTALSLNEQEALAVSGLAMVDFYENRIASALAGLRKAVTLDPNEPDYVFNLGQAAARNEKYMKPLMLTNGFC